MPDLKETRRKLKIAFATLALIDVAAAIVFFSPVVGSMESRLEQLNQLRGEAERKAAEVEPLKDLDKKVDLARQQIAGFYKGRLPGRDSAISDELGKLAGQSGVKITEVKYTMQDEEPMGLRPVRIEANLSGDYLQLVRFINGLERDPLFFLINRVELGGEQGGVVKLQMRLETYLKTGA